MIIRLLKQKIKNHFLENQSIPNINVSLRRLKELGFYPKNIFDVGAFQGEFAKLCFTIWPETKIVCFEPLYDKYVLLDSWSKKDNRLKAIYGLVGEQDRDTVKFNESETASSVLDEHLSIDFKCSFKNMRTIDTCINEFQLTPPNLLKIDTQGYEYQVLQGFDSNLSHVDVILAELNHIDIHKDVKLAEEVIALLYSKGFIIYDITEIHRRPSDHAIWQTDFIFVKKDSFLRQSKKW